MRHRKYTFKIGRTPAHRSAMMANMVSSLIECGEIRTTVVKAKEARRFAEKMITYGKQGDLHHRRLAVAKLRDKHAVRILFDEVAPRYLEREGGYTRIIRLGRRIGDAAEMCILQLVEEELEKKKTTKKSSKKKDEAVVETSEVTAEEQVEDSSPEETDSEEVVSEEKESKEEK